MISPLTNLLDDFKVLERRTRTRTTGMRHITKKKRMVSDLCHGVMMGWCVMRCVDGVCMYLT